MLYYTKKKWTDLVSRVINEGYCPDPTDQEIEAMGRDPFLLAYALADPLNHTIVTTEVSKPSKRRANRKVPDVGRDLGITGKGDRFILSRS